MDAVILGDGPLGRAIAAALVERGDRARVLGRPATADGRHDPAELAGADVVFEASRGGAVAANVASALGAGVRRVVIATTAWDADRPRVTRLLEEHATLDLLAFPAPPAGLVAAGRRAALQALGQAAPEAFFAAAAGPLQGAAASAGLRLAALG